MASTYELAQQRPQDEDASMQIRVRINPWQRVLALVALIPAIIGLGFYVAAATNHREDYSAIAQCAYGTVALSIAGSLGLLWLLVGAITWQIKRNARAGRPS